MPLRLSEPFKINAVSVRRLNVPSEEQADETPLPRKAKKGSQPAAEHDGQSADTTEEK